MKLSSTNVQKDLFKANSLKILKTNVIYQQLECNIFYNSTQLAKLIMTPIFSLNLWTKRIDEELMKEEGKLPI